MEPGRGFRDNIVAKCRRLVAKSGGLLVKHLRIRSTALPQESTAAPSSSRQHQQETATSRVLHQKSTAAAACSKLQDTDHQAAGNGTNNNLTASSTGGGIATRGAPANELKTTLGMSFGAAIAIYGLLNSSATKLQASPRSLYLLIAALTVSFSASLIGLAIPWIAPAMEPIAVASIAVTFFMAMTLLLPEGIIRWVALIAGAFVLLLYLLGPSLKRIYDFILHKLRGIHVIRRDQEINRVSLI